MAGVVHIPWYVTVFRGDKFELAIQEIAPVALRYGATDYAVYRGRDDRYRFLQLASFEHKLDFDRYWNGEEFIGWRADYSSWYQVPVLYAWNDLVIAGGLDRELQRTTSAPAEGDTIG
jgi:hypothetical protein